jgi:hypothetical protein
VIARDETWYGEERRDRMLLLLPEARLFLVLSSRARIGLTLGGRITSGLDDRWQHPAEMDGFHLTLHLRGGHFSRSERTDGPH